MEKKSIFNISNPILFETMVNIDLRNVSMLLE
jgi:hypothetical protein